MKNLSTGWVAMVFFLAAGTAIPDEPGEFPFDDDPPLQQGCCEKGYYERVITCYKKVCREEKVPVVVKKCFYRDEIRKVKTTVLVPREFIERRIKVKVIPVPREEYCLVKRCRKVPVKLVDPDTGCTIITYKEEWYTERVRRVVIDQKVEKVLVKVKVCRLVPEERMEDQRYTVREWRNVQVIQTKLHCVHVPYQKTVRIPCPPPGPNYRVEVPLNFRPTPPPPLSTPKPSK